MRTMLVPPRRGIPRWISDDDDNDDDADATAGYRIATVNDFSVRLHSTSAGEEGQRDDTAQPQAFEAPGGKMASSNSATKGERSRTPRHHTTVCLYPLCARLGVQIHFRFRIGAAILADVYDGGTVNSPHQVRAKRTIIVRRMSSLNVHPVE